MAQATPPCARRTASCRWLPLATATALLLGATCAVTANPFLRGAECPRPILNIAHAGASSVAPQNTLAAGQAALELGADVWGVDARLSEDGVLVLMHDATLDRTTDVEAQFPTRAPWKVEAFTFTEIRTLDAGSWFLRDDPFGQIGAGCVAAAALTRYAGERVPSLREALGFVAAHEWRIDIELKPTEGADPEDLARRVVDLLVETRTTDRAMISSFDHEILRAVKALDPTIPTGALAIFAPRDLVAYLDDLGADVYLPSLVGFTEDLLTELSDAGFGVHVWTYNAEAQFERLVSTPGITGITTDFPQRLDLILRHFEQDAHD